MAKGKLTVKQRAFVSFFLGDAKGNATQAARLAGMGRTVKSHRQLGHVTLMNLDVQRALAAVTQKREARQQMRAEERDVILADIARSERVEAQHRIKAIDVMNKCDGRYSVTHKLEGRLTLEQVLQESREGEK